MQIADKSVVHIHYTLKNDAGETLDSSAGGEPLAYLHGMGNLVPGLEKMLTGKSAGEKLHVKVSPEEGYGVRDASLIQQMPKRMFQGIREIQVGMRFNAQSDKGLRQVTVTRVAGDMVTVDGNHDLAGVTLNFDIEITAVRAATEEELSHGHVHGAGGHHH